jgi:hypothetical protein
MHFVFNPSNKEYELLITQVKPLDKFVLATVGKFGPMSIPKIHKKLLDLQLSEDFSSYSSIKLSDNLIRQSTNRLVRLNFVAELPKRRRLNKKLKQETPDCFKKKLRKEPSLIALKFPGLIWYFRDSDPKDKESERIYNFLTLYTKPFGTKKRPHFKGVIQRTSEILFPFCPYWAEIFSQTKDFWMQLQQTIDSFYLRENNPTIYGKYQLATNKQKHEERKPAFFNYLREHPDPFLRESYICYLITEQSLDRTSMDKIVSILDELEFIKESKILGVACTNKAELEKFLMRIFPRYDTLPKLFTGYFVSNLLWG